MVSSFGISGVVENHRYLATAKHAQTPCRHSVCTIFCRHQAPDLKPHNMDLKNGPHGIQHNLFGVLSHNYEWCPKLRSISLTHCVTEPSDILLYLSCRRIKGLDVAPIEEIRLDRCSYIDDLLYDMVKSDLGVSVFETQDYQWMTRRMWRQLCLDAKHQRRGQHRQ
jgi:hypothetical protein